MGHWVHGHKVRRTKYIGRGRYLSYWGWQHGYYVGDRHHHHTRYVGSNESQFPTWVGIGIIIIAILIFIKLYF